MKLALWERRGGGMEVGGKVRAGQRRVHRDVEHGVMRGALHIIVDSINSHSPNCGLAILIKAASHKPHDE